MTFDTLNKIKADIAGRLYSGNADCISINPVAFDKGSKIIVVNGKAIRAKIADDHLLVLLRDKLVIYDISKLDTLNRLDLDDLPTLV